MPALTQNQQILSYLKSGKKLTPKDALKKFGCFRLSSRVFDLRRNGHAIITDPMKATSDQGVTVTTICMMHYGAGNQTYKWSERGFSNADHNTTPSGGFKDFRMGIIAGQHDGTNVTNTNVKTVYGTMSIYGVR